MFSGSYFALAILQDIAFFDEESVGILTSRLGSDCQQVSRILGHDLNIMLRNALQVIFVFSKVLWYLIFDDYLTYLLFRV